MAFQGRSRDTIRDQLLADWSAEYTARGYTLLISEGSPSWMLANSLAATQELLEAQAEQNARDILPDQASTEALNRHGYVDGVERRPATPARYTVTVTGTNGTYPLVGLSMVAPDGNVYDVSSTSVVIALGTGTVSVQARIAGASGTRSTGDVLTWTTAPAGINPTGVIATEINPGIDRETDASYADRIIDRRRERPGSGNRSDWRDWVRSYIGLPIDDAFVYPLLEPPASVPGVGTEGVLGCVSVVAVGPAQGDSTTNTRIVGGTPGATLSLVKSYIEGDVTDEGVATAVGIQLRPVTIDPANYTVEAANVSPTVVTMAVTVNSANAYQWSGTMTVVSGTTTTLVVSGDQTANAGLRALVFVGTGNVRGGYQFVTLGAAVFGGVNTTFSQTGAQQLLGAPSGTVYPASLNYPSIRLAVLNLFDALTPGDTATPSRWPAENSIISPQIARLVPSRIVAAVQDVVGVISVTVSNPASILTPTTKSIITLSTLTVTP